MKLKERYYWLGFNIFPGIGPKRFYLLLKIFGSAKKAWQAPKEKLFNLGIPHSIITRFLDFRERINLYQEFLRLEKKLIKFVIVEDENYPINLKKIKNPPAVIYFKGKILKQDRQSLAVVGTRKITPYGREVTEKLTKELSNSGFTIISGLARGIDSVAHQTALESGGRTIAVLGSSLDIIYPPENRVLAQKIIQLKKGALISQLPLGMGPLKGHFPARNRIISGLSLGVLVTEGASHSGSKITSADAFEQKKPVFAVPGPITSAMSEGPLDLIKQGAKLVSQAKDILKFFHLDNHHSNNQKKRNHFSNPQQQKIWQELIKGRKQIDEIIRRSKFSSAEVLSILTEMELAGMVKNIGGGNYIIV